MTGRLIWGNVGWNLVGALLPLLVAIVAIPVLIARLGDERFGILAIGWVITIFFVLSDFGIGVATKRFLASEPAGENPPYASLIWTSMSMHAVFGFLGGCILVLVTPLLLEYVFNVRSGLLHESSLAFLWLAASILPLLLTSFLRNLLEARHRFDLTNMLQFPASTINYLIPVVALQFTDNLALLLAAVFAGRLLVLGAHLLIALHAIPELRSPFKFSMLWARQLFGFGGWITLSSLVTAAVLISDRLMVANLFGVASVTYYVTPYEIITKLWIISASVLGALFPAFVAWRYDSDKIQKTYRVVLLVFGLLSAPLVSLLIVFSRDFLGWWISPTMAAEGGTVAKWIALGAFFSILSQLPMTILQATGKPEIVTKIQLLLFPVFIMLAFWLSHQFGAVGIAMAWCGRQVTELGFIYMQSARWNSCRLAVGEGLAIYLFIVTPMLFICCWLIERVYRDEVGIKMMAFLLFMVIYMLASGVLLRDYGIKSMLTSVRGKFMNVS
jgi:O-antigen/teichoic acid export membrane protein